MPVTEQERMATDGMPPRDSVVWQDPERLGGEPCFAGTRVPVRALFDYIEGGDTLADFFEDFPGVSREQVRGALLIGKAALVGGGRP